MKILFIHHRFPGQFVPLVEGYLAAGAQVVAICHTPERTALAAATWSQIRLMTCDPVQHTAKAMAGGYSQEWLAGSLRVRNRLLQLRQQGFYPDVCLTHIGFGDGLFVKDIFPETRCLAYCEYYYHAAHSDLDFDPEFSVPDSGRVDIKTPNAYTLLALNDADAAVSPTEWQKRRFPPACQPRIAVIHEGVDTRRCRPDASACFTLNNGQVLRHGDEVVTYATRNLEPYRGFHSFMRTLAVLMQRRPRLQVVIAGGDEVSYSRPLPEGQTYRETFLAEPGLDRSRLHFVGHLPFDAYCRLLQVSRVHVYLTVPFVLSWSLLEAMACQCAIVASDTEPVREVLRDGYSALTGDFFNPEQLASQIERLLLDAELRVRLSTQARRTVVERYNRDHTFDSYQDLLKRITP